MADQNSNALARLTKGASTVADRGKTFWSGLRPQQRLFLGIGAAVTLGASILLVNMIVTPTYKPLMSGLDPADAQTIAAQLAAKKIPYQTGPDGTSIRVPASQLDAARLEVASHDATHSGRIGFEIFDKTSWGQTEFDEKVNYQRALEGELERTVQTIHNVKSARVHLVMPTDSVFIDNQRGAKASVIVRLKSGTLSRDEVNQIARLVAGSVDQLDPKDVVITDAEGNRALSGNDAQNPDGDTLQQQLTKRLMATLAPVVGNDRIHATVDVEYETASSEENDEKYDPAVSAVLNMQRSEESGAVGQQGVPGTSSNVPAAKTTAVSTTGSTGPSSKTESATYGVNKITRHEIDPAGGIRRITAAVVLDDAVDRQLKNGKWVSERRKISDSELKTITSLAQATIGYDAARGDVVSVQNVSFNRSDDSDFPPDTWMERMRQQLGHNSSIIAYAGLVALFIAVYFLMFRPIQKRVWTPAPQALPPAPETLTLPVETTIEHSTEVPARVAAQRSLELKNELAAFIKSDPDAGTSAIRSWLREEV